MGPISSVRPVVQTLGTSPHQTAGHQPVLGTAARNGARAELAAPAEALRPVLPMAGGERASDAGEDSFRVEAARARAEAAQRAYMMASLLEGRNPLSDPVP
jgi:hypothetical protein